MNRFRVISRFKSTIDGAVVDQGDEIGILETAMSQDFVLSMIRSGAALVLNEPEFRQSQAAIAATPVSPPAPTPPAIETPPQAPAVATVEPDDDTDADLEPLAGLAPRVAQSLQAAGLSDAQAIRDYLAQGDKLVDLEGIGKATEAQILDWLDSAV